MTGWGWNKKRLDEDEERLNKKNNTHLSSTCLKEETRKTAEWRWSSGGKLLSALKARMARGITLLLHTVLCNGLWNRSADQQQIFVKCENNVAHTGNGLMADWYSSYFRANISMT